MNKTILSLFFLLAASLAGCGPHNAAPSCPFVLWDWQSETPLSPSDRALLQERKVPFLFVKAAGVVLADGLPTLERKLTRETLLSYGKIPLHFCYRPSRELTQAFETLDPQDLGQWLGERFLSDAQEAQAAGAVVQGMQLDFDCPTRLLPRYGTMLAALVPVLKQGGNFQFSITAMETWLHHLSFRSLARKADFFVPILYGYDIPPVLKDLPPLASRTRLFWAQALCHLVGKPYWIGLPAYTAPFVYDEKGRFLSVENELFLDDLSQSRNLLYEGSQRRRGSDEMEHSFSVLRAFSWKGLEFQTGWKVVVEETTPAQLRLLLGDLGVAKGRFMGAALFHLDKGGQGRSIPLTGIMALAKPQAPSHDLDLRAEFLGEKADEMTLSVVLANKDPFPSLMGYSPVRLEVRIKDGSFEDVEPGDFQKVEFAHGFQDRLEASSQGRANVALFMKERLGPLARAQSGTLRVRRIGPHFAIYLYASMDSSMLLKRLFMKDVEVYPQPLSPGLSLGEVGQ